MSEAMGPRMVMIESEDVTGDFQSAALYAEHGAGVVVRGRASATARLHPEIPDFDDRPWNGPYDDE